MGRHLRVAISVVALLSMVVLVAPAVRAESVHTLTVTGTMVRGTSLTPLPPECYGVHCATYSGYFASVDGGTLTTFDFDALLTFFSQPQACRYANVEWTMTDTENGDTLYGTGAFEQVSVNSEFRPKITGGTGRFEGATYVGPDLPLNSGGPQPLFLSPGDPRLSLVDLGLTSCTTTTMLRVGQLALTYALP
jgi:hypothetical protein